MAVGSESKVAKLKPGIARRLPNELTNLPADFGCKQVNAFVRAVEFSMTLNLRDEASGGGNGKRPAVTATRFAPAEALVQTGTTDYGSANPIGIIYQCLEREEGT